MKDFLFVYRSDASVLSQRSPEEMQANTQKWMDWIGNIAAQNKLTARGDRLHPSGKVLRANKVVTDGPYTELKESLGGYSIVKAASLEDATELAKDCPIFLTGGSLEVREINVM
ncbi:YciI family protein [Chitinophaga sp.]|uniref:YciI family protein n=1 Tax=Chitinophaga sp. TaxID=1869181 RepID=UPI002F92850C